MKRMKRIAKKEVVSKTVRGNQIKTQTRDNGNQRNTNPPNKKERNKKKGIERKICEFPPAPLRPPLMPSIHHPASNISYSVAPLLTAELISALITLIGRMLMKERDEAFWDSGLIPPL